MTRCRTLRPGLSFGGKCESHSVPGSVCSGVSEYILGGERAETRAASYSRTCVFAPTHALFLETRERERDSRERDSRILRGLLLLGAHTQTRRGLGRSTATLLFGEPAAGCAGGLLAAGSAQGVAPRQVRARPTPGARNTAPLDTRTATSRPRKLLFFEGRGFWSSSLERLKGVARVSRPHRSTSALVSVAHVQLSDNCSTARVRLAEGGGFFARTTSVFLCSKAFARCPRPSASGPDSRSSSATTTCSNSSRSRSSKAKRRLFMGNLSFLR